MRKNFIIQPKSEEYDVLKKQKEKYQLYYYFRGYIYNRVSKKKK